MDASKKGKRTYSVKEYTLYELAYIYGMSKYRFLRRIERHTKEIGKRIGNYYEIPQVVTIFKLIQPPSDVEIIW